VIFDWAAVGRNVFVQPAAPAPNEMNPTAWMDTAEASDVLTISVDLGDIFAPRSGSKIVRGAIYAEPFGKYGTRVDTWTSGVK
jgi:hypothetical protein